MQKLLALVDRLLHFLLITTLLLLIVPVSLQIFSRFTDLIPRYMWTEEMSRFFFVWLIMLGATLGVRERLHFDVDFFPDLSGRTAHVLLRLSQRLGRSLELPERKVMRESARRLLEGLPLEEAPALED